MYGGEWLGELPCLTYASVIEVIEVILVVVITTGPCLSQAVRPAG